MIDDDATLSMAEILRRSGAWPPPAPETPAPRTLVLGDPRKPAPAAPPPIERREPISPPIAHERHFYRCRDCLAPMAVEGARHAALACSCGGATDYLGRVQADRLVRDVDRVPCDSRCTSATGPECECKCQGKFHGSNLIVRVELDAGPIPRATRVKDAAKRIAVSEMFGAELDATRRHYASRWSASGDADPLAWAVLAQIRRAETLRSIKGRQSALDRAEALIAEADKQRFNQMRATT